MRETAGVLPADDPAAGDRGRGTGPFRLAVLRDFPEEGWPSMELCADRLLEHLRDAPQVAAEGWAPPFRRRFTRLPWLGRKKAAFNGDRLANRLWDYPRSLRRRVREFDAFHVCDHTYAQLAHVLPAGRTGVLCHDLDAFRCLVDPGVEPRPKWFQAMARHVLRGLQKAAVIFYTTEGVREGIVRHGLLDPARLVKVPLGVAPEFTPDAAGLLPPPVASPGAPYVLHVGSCIPRKRIDVLLEVFARLRRGRPGLKLVKVGGPWTADQARQIQRLGLADAIVQLMNLDRADVARLYGRAAVVLMPSDAEGFGLPVIEALACGAPVAASDLPVLREVGGDAAVYCPVGDAGAWADAVGRLLDDPGSAPPPEARLRQAGKYSWQRHADVILAAYGKLPGRAG